MLTVLLCIHPATKKISCDRLEMMCSVLYAVAPPFQKYVSPLQVCLHVLLNLASSFWHSGPVTFSPLRLLLLPLLQAAGGKCSIHREPAVHRRPEVVLSRHVAFEVCVLFLVSTFSSCDVVFIQGGLKKVYARNISNGSIFARFRRQHGP